MKNEEFYTQCVDCIFFRDGICKVDKDRYLITEDGREKLMWECDEVPTLGEIHKRKYGSN